MKNFIYFLFVLSLIMNFNLYADSPVTSTNISTAYKNYEIVVKASNSNGDLSVELLEYLLLPENPIDVKIAMINELSWDVDGKTNSLIFWRYIKEFFDYDDEQDFQKYAHADHLLCMAYLKALDNYHNVDKAIVYADLALVKNKESYTFNIIHALINAQKQMDYDWCQVYLLTHEVRTNDNLIKDMKITAVNNIFRYMDLYKDNCK